MNAASVAKSLVMAILIAGSIVPAAWAASDDWAACREAATRLEQQHALPKGMVTSIALVESGRRAPNGSLQAWPWTINAEGRPYYFATREDAVNAVRRLLAEGMRTIDVGCMQVNLRFHPRAFTSVEEAFDPMSNVAYAAYFLRDLESRSESWHQAIGRYHSFSPSLNERYSARVQAVWAKEQKQAARHVVSEVAESEADLPEAAGLRLSSFSDELYPAGPSQPIPGIRPAAVASAETASVAR